MKKHYFIAAGLAICLQIANIANAQQTAPFKTRKQFSMPAAVTEKDYIPKTIIFKLKPELRANASPGFIQNTDLQKVLDYVGVDKMAKKFPRHYQPEMQYNSLGQKYADLSLIYELKYTKDVAIVNVINQLLATGIMEFAEPHYIYQVNAYTPNDPAANSTSSTSGQKNFLTRIRAFDAWDVALGGTHGDPNIVIAIVDSGSDLDHPDLVTQFVHNTADPINGKDDDNDGYIDNYTGWDLSGADYNNVVGDNDANITGSNNDHGSHVSGCAAAATDNGLGVAGVGFNCKLLPVKCSADNDTRGTSGEGYISQGYDGITYAADHGAKIINCSWGGPGGGDYGQTIIDYAVINKNCLVVASAGNSNADVTNYPASYNYVISVAATNSSNDNRANFSCYNYTVDISAPGYKIYETIYDNKYQMLDGTSMASPIVAGGAGLVQSKFKYTNALQIGQRLKQTSDNLYVAGPNITGSGNTGAAYQNRLGKGRMNLGRAMTDPTNIPSVVFTNDHEVDHNDNVIVIGDSVFITGDFINYLAPTTNLTATVTAINNASYVTMIKNTANLGALSTLQSKNNNTNPFVFKVNTGTPLNSVITFQITLTDGSYTDSYFIDVIVNVDYINIAVNDVGVSITSKGKIGWNADGEKQGIGFTYMGTNFLYEGGLMIGSSNTTVSDCFRGATPSAADTSFKSEIVVSRANPSVKSDFDAHGRFNDSSSATIQNLVISHSAYAWISPGNRKYVIVDYVIKNIGTSVLDSLYAGIAADWDIDSKTASKNRGNYDATTKMGYVYSTVTGGKYAGIKVLTNNAPPVCYQIDNTKGGGGAIDVNDSDYFSIADKYRALSTNHYLAGDTAVDGTDVISVVSSGPFIIKAGDSIQVAFALIAGDDLGDIKKSADSAQVHYTGKKPSGITFNKNQEIDVVVFPNPTNNNLNFVFNNLKAEMVEITLVNTLGQTVKTITRTNMAGGYNRVSVDVSELPEGTYFYRINTGDKMTVGKIIITK